MGDRGGSNPPARTVVASPDLDAAEQRLLAALFGDGQAAPDGAADADNAVTTGREHVRASFVAGLLRGEHGPLPAIGLSADELVVDGELDLTYAEIAVPVVFAHCAFPDGVDLSRAMTRDLGFVDCEIGTPAADTAASEPPAGLRARRARVEGDLTISGCTFHGIANLPGLRTAGDLTVSHSVIGAGVVSAWGVFLDDADIGGSVTLGPELRLDGGCSLASASVTGAVALEDVTTSAESPLALQGDRARIAKHLSIVQSSLNGKVSLSGAAIDDWLGVLRSKLGTAGDEPGLAIDHAQIGTGLRMVGTEVANGLLASSARVGGEVVLAEGVRILGTTALAGLDLSGATLAGISLGPRVEIEHGISLNLARVEGFTALVGVSLGSTSGSIDLGDPGAGFASVVALAQDHSVSAANAVFGGTVLITDTELRGVLNLAGAEIGGALRVQDTTITAARMLADGVETAMSITLAGARVTQDVMFARVHAAGALLLVAATIGAGLGLQDCTLGADPAGGPSPASLLAVGVSTKRVFLARTRAVGSIVLDEADLTGTLALFDVTCGRSELEVALSCTGTKLRGAMVLDRVVLRGVLQLAGITVSQDLTATALHIHSGDVGVVADRGRIEGSVRLRSGCAVAGRIQAQRLEVGGDVLVLGTAARRGLDLLASVIGGSIVIGERCALGTADEPLTPAVDLQHAAVVGNVIVHRAARLSGSLDATSCRIGGGVRLREAEVGASAPRGLLLASAEVAKDLELGPDLVIRGAIDLGAVHLAGHLNADGCRLLETSAMAGGVFGNGLRVDGSMIVVRTEIEGLLALGVATIGGDVQIHSMRVASSVLHAAGEAIEVAIHLGQSRVGGDVVCSDLTTGGTVSLAGMTIAGAVIVRHGTIGTDPSAGGEASAPAAASLLLDHAEIRGLVLVDDTSVRGRVSLDHATVNGDIALAGLSAGQPEGDAAVSGTGLRTHGRLAIGRHSELVGAVGLDGSAIQSDLVLHELAVRRTSPGGKAFHADGAEVHGRMVIDHAAFEGPVYLDSLTVHDDTAVVDTRIDGDPPWSLVLDNAVFRADLVLADLEVAGGTSLDDVHVTGDVAVRRLSSGADPGQAALTARRAAVTGRFTLQPLTAPGSVDLSGAHVGELDDRPDTWDRVGGIRLAGLQVDHLGDQARTQGSNWTPEQRRDWLDRAAADTFAPYETFATGYNERGETGAARLLRIAGARRQASPITRLALGWLGYGYRLANALIPFAVAFVAVLVVLYWGRADDRFVPTDASAADVRSSECVEDQYPCLQPIGYALDVLVPVVDFDEQSAWRPTSTWLRVFLWIATASGWLLTTLLVLAFTNRFRS